MTTAPSPRKRPPKCTKLRRSKHLRPFLQVRSVASSRERKKKERERQRELFGNVLSTLFLFPFSSPSFLVFFPPPPPPPSSSSSSSSFMKKAKLTFSCSLFFLFFFFVSFFFDFLLLSSLLFKLLLSRYRELRKDYCFLQCSNSWKGDRHCPKGHFGG